MDDRHALYAGWVLGLAMKWGLPFVPVTDDNGYTDRLAMPLPDGHTLIVVVPYPPEDWTLSE